MTLRGFIPLAVFLLLIALLWAGLKLDPRKIPSPLVDKPAPEFSLPRLDAPEKTVNSKDFLGQVWLLNIWASCVRPAERNIRYSMPGLNKKMYF